jgi:hypothetical protein
MLSTYSAILELHNILQNITNHLPVDIMAQHFRRLRCPARQWTHHNSPKFQSSMSYCIMTLLEPIQHQLTEWSASDKWESIWNWLWLHNGTIPAPSGTEEYPPPTPNLPSKKSPCPGQTSTQEPPKYVYSITTIPTWFWDYTFHDVTHPKYGPDFKALLPVQTPAEMLRSSLDEFKNKKEVLPLGIQFLLRMNNMVPIILSMR